MLKKLNYTTLDEDKRRPLNGKKYVESKSMQEYLCTYSSDEEDIRKKISSESKTIKKGE
jgi:hypothetical protein